MFGRFFARVSKNLKPSALAARLRTPAAASSRRVLAAGSVLAATSAFALTSLPSSVSNESRFAPLGIFSRWGLPTASAAAFRPPPEGDVPPEGLPGTKQERTFIAIKPDGVQRGLIGTIIQRFEAKGYKLVAMKFRHATESEARGHYADLSAKPFFKGLVKYFSSGPIVTMVWEGKDVIKGGRVLLGATDPADSAPGTIRHDFCIDVSRNLIHGSDSPSAASHEINYWFRSDEIAAVDSCTDKWIYE